MFKDLKVDLHMHSNFSDGVFSPLEIIEIAKQRKMDIISLTDHDCLDGSIELFLTKKIKSIIGVEMSTVNKESNVHILGYFRDLENALKFKEKILDLQEKRNNRAKEIAELLKEKKNIIIDINSIKGAKVINRKNIADEVMKKYPSIKRQEIFSLISRGGDCYVQSFKIETNKLVDMLHKHNALAIVAHPVLIKRFDINEFLEMKIDGLEAIYPRNTVLETEKFVNLCIENDLLITGGSDFHEFGDLMHGEIGKFYVSGKQVEKFLRRVGVK